MQWDHLNDQLHYGLLKTQARNSDLSKMSGDVLEIVWMSLKNHNKCFACFFFKLQ